MSAKAKNIVTLLLLHFIYAIFSFTGVFSKLASQCQFLSFKFCLCYGGVIAMLGIYAIIWQQIIKRVELSKAYANKAVGVIWAIVWGCLFFDEQISVLKIIGAAIIMIGTAMFFMVDKKDESQ